MSTFIQKITLEWVTLWGVSYWQSVKPRRHLQSPYIWPKDPKRLPQWIQSRCLANCNVPVTWEFWAGQAGLGGAEIWHFKEHPADSNQPLLVPWSPNHMFSSKAIKNRWPWLFSRQPSPRPGLLDYATPTSRELFSYLLSSQRCSRV